MNQIRQSNALGSGRVAGWNAISDDDVHIWPIKLSAESGLIAHSYSALSEKERERTTRLRSDVQKTAFVLSRGILRFLLARYCNRRASDLEIAYGREGKPFLTNVVSQAGSPIQFNLSHSGELVVYAITIGRNVGVDIERHRYFPNMSPIAERFFSPIEYCELMRTAEPERNLAFLNCWVRKEAYTKAVGGGLTIPMDSFEVSVAPRQPAALLSICNDSAEACKWTMHEFLPARGYSGAVAFRDVSCQIRVYPEWPLHELL